MITVRKAETKKDIRQFILGPREIYREDPLWVPPILKELTDFFNPKKNPFYGWGTADLLLAEKDGNFAGRLSVQTNSLHDKKYGAGTGFFGFPEFIDDPEVSGALFEEGEKILKGRGAKRVIGPFNFDINNECGLLIDGFDTPPAIMMTHNPKYYLKHVEDLGYKKEKDLLAWTYIIGDIPEMAVAAADMQKDTPGLVIREADMANLERDIKIVTDVYNDAWSDNWGSLPLSDEESKQIAKHLKPILRKEFVLIAELEGDPIAVVFGAPDINETLRDMGKCNSWFDLLRFLWRLKHNTPKSARLLILGIKKSVRGKGMKYLSVLLYVEMHKRAKQMGIEKGECSWTLEDNDKINRGIELMGGKIYKTYRIVSKDLL